MKIAKAKSIILKNMVRQFYETGKETYNFESIKSFLPEELDHIVKLALSALKSDGFVSILYAENIPYQIFLLSKAVISVDEDTLIKKGYNLVKEIKSFF